MTSEKVVRSLKRTDFSIQTAHLRGADKKRKNAVRAMYQGLAPMEQRLLRAARAQRALDVIAMLNIDLPNSLQHMSGTQRQALIDVANMTNRLIPKLIGLAKLADK